MNLNPAARIASARNGAAYRALLSLREWQRLEADADRELVYAQSRAWFLPFNAAVETRRRALAAVTAARIDLNQVRRARLNAEHILQAAKRLPSLVALWRGR